MALLGVAVAILACLVLFDLLLSFGVIRRVREIEAGPLRRPNSIVDRGTRVGRFAASDLAGEEVSDRTLSQGEFIVGFLQAGCEPCQNVKDNLRHVDLDVPLITFLDGVGADSGEEELHVLAEFGRVVSLADAQGAMEAFDVGFFPALFRVIDGAVAESGVRLRDVSLHPVKTTEPAAASMSP